MDADEIECQYCGVFLKYPTTIKCFKDNNILEVCGKCADLIRNRNIAGKED